MDYKKFDEPMSSWCADALFCFDSEQYVRV